jgi:FixJ family two-component response regulator
MSDSQTSTVFVVDDDQKFRESLHWIVESVGLHVESYADAQTFLVDRDADRPGCLLLDVRMPGMDGLALQAELMRRSDSVPIIFVTGYGEVSTAVRALKNGAFDFLEKPFSEQVLLECIRRAIEIDRQGRERRAETVEQVERMARLTPREIEVVDLVAAGMPSKMIADELGVSMKTIEFHRGNLMRKLEVSCLADVLSIVLAVRGRRVESAASHDGAESGLMVGGGRKTAMRGVQSSPGLRHIAKRNFA